MRPDREHSLLRTAEGRRAARLLEWSTLLDDVSAHCGMATTRELVRAIEPSSDGEALADLWGWVAELVRYLESGHDLPITDIEDLAHLLAEDRKETGPLGGDELAAVGGAARSLSELLRAAQAHGDRLTRTARRLRGAADPGGLADHLAAALEADGHIKDSASPRLASLRRAARAAESSVRDVARREMGRATNKGWSNGPEIVLRGDRFCVPLRSGARGSVDGIVHDRSSSGQTLFVEPSAVVEAGNIWAEARLAVEDEERRILIDLNRQVAQYRTPLLDLFERAVEIDAMRARARWGRAHGGEIPERVGSRQELYLEGFRHPLLAKSLRAAGHVEELVPLDLRLEDGRLLLISGPNAGGKTVALKSLGLAVLMSQSGIPMPCAHPPRLPRFDHVLLDLGDEQSIADALSSFSAHLSHLQALLDLVSERSLVLLDEIGGGTDPQEGIALARAVLEHLVNVGCRTLVTTHYGQLKALVEEDSRFRHASMAFDHERLLPRFALQLDVPGASHALEIADRMELPHSVLERARELVGDDRLQLDSLLRDLERSRDETVRLEVDLREQIDGAKKTRQHYDGLARELKEKRRSRIQEAEREAEGIVRNARKQIEGLLRQIREAGGSDAAVEAAQQARQEIDERAENLEKRRPRSKDRSAPARIEVGELARHSGLGQVGRIIEVRGERVTLQIGETRVVASPGQLVAPDDVEAAEAVRPVRGTIRTQLVDASPLAASEIDVRGYDVEDAWRLVDRAIDRCLVRGMRELEVIHGKGTGRLRAVLGQRLGEDPRIRRAEVGAGGRRDDGITRIEL